MSSVLRHSGYRSAVERPAVGDTKTSMVRVDHLGWLVCDGRSLLRSEYRNLFAVIGTEFGEGNDAGRTFNLPDARGRVVGLINTVENQSSDSALSVRNDGDISGEEMHELTIAEIPAHNHDISGGYLNVSGGVVSTEDGNTSLNTTDITINSTTNSSGNGTGFVQATGSGTNNGSNLDNGNGEPSLNASIVLASLTDPGHRHQIASNGGGDAHNNMQPTLFMGNLFIFCGQVLKNITTADGVTPATSNPSYYPPSVPANRLY